MPREIRSTLREYAVAEDITKAELDVKGVLRSRAGCVCEIQIVDAEMHGRVQYPADTWHRTRLVVPEPEEELPGCWIELEHVRTTRALVSDAPVVMAIAPIALRIGEQDSGRPIRGLPTGTRSQYAIKLSLDGLADLGVATAEHVGPCCLTDSVKLRRGRRTERAARRNGGAVHALG